MSLAFHDGDNFIRNAVTVLGPRTMGKGPRIRKISTGGLPVPIDEILEDLRVDDPDDDEATVERMARAACAFIEKRTGYSMLPTVFELTGSQWWSGCPLEILMGPLRSIDAVEYLRDRDDWVEVAAADYWTSQGDRDFFLRFLDSFDRPTLWQREDCVRIRFQTGFDAADESGGDHPIEDGLRTVLLMVTGHYYQNREMLGAADAKYGLQAVELGATSLLGAYRQFW